MEDITNNKKMLNNDLDNISGGNWSVHFSHGKHDKSLTHRFKSKKEANGYADSLKKRGYKKVNTNYTMYSPTHKFNVDTQRLDSVGSENNWADTLW